jgi:hypothetical protein
MFEIKTHSTGFITVGHSVVKENPRSEKSGDLDALSVEMVESGQRDWGLKSHVTPTLSHEMGNSGKQNVS